MKLSLKLEPDPRPADARADLAAAAEQRPARPMRVVVWPLLRPYKWVLLAAIALNAAHGIAISFQTLIPKYLIDDVLLAPDAGGRSPWLLLALLVGGYLFASLVGRMIVWHVSYRMFTAVREKMVFELRRTFFRHVNELCLRFHRQTHSGELFTYLFGSPLATVTGYFNHFATSVPGAVFTLGWTLAWVSLWDPLMTLVLAGSVVATVVLMQRSHRKIRALHEDYQQVESTVSAHVADLLRGTRDVKLYAYERPTVDRFAERVETIGRKSYQRDIKTHLHNMWYEGAGYVFFAMLCTVGAVRFKQGAITVGELQAYLTAYIALQWPLGTLFSLAISHGAASAGLARIDAVLQTASSTPDPLPRETPVAVPTRGAITLDSVAFSYDGQHPVLRGINLTIPYGQHVALVGPSGSGKSTLAQLLLRLYDPDAGGGSITLGGVDLRHLRGSDLRARFGVVPQDPFIFRTTVRENLKVANPLASDAELEQACRSANAWDFIASLPRGLDTDLAEAGASLSGGQKQRLAIARALLKNPDYFLFDEATSALDTVSEGLIQGAVENAWHGRTAVIIAHRLSTVRNCDRILVLRDGQIMEDGTYDDLVRRGGLFGSLVDAQRLAA